MNSKGERRFAESPFALNLTILRKSDLPIIETPPGLIPAEVPLDPALAIANRFGKLAEAKTE